MTRILVDRHCRVCDTRKPFEQFHRDASKKGGYRSVCKRCEREYRGRRTEMMKWRHIQQSYHLTREQYENMLEAQGGGCAACGSTDSLRVDHDHSCCPTEKTCGKCIRGILCHKCNCALGMLRDRSMYVGFLLNYIKLRESKT